MDEAGTAETLEKRLKMGACSPPRTRVFLAKSGAARYQVRAFSAPSPTAPHGSPQ